MSALVGDKFIAIVPVLGWWDQRRILKTQDMRFSLTVSVLGPGVYAAIKPRIEAEALVSVECSVPTAPSTIADDVERYLRTGETDPHHAAWPGNGFMERTNRAHEDLRGQRHAELGDDVVTREPGQLEVLEEVDDPPLAHGAGGEAPDALEETHEPERRLLGGSRPRCARCARQRVLQLEPFTAVHQRVGRHQFTGSPVGNARGSFLNPPVFAGLYATRDARDGLGREPAEITRGHVEGGLGAFSALCL